MTYDPDGPAYDDVNREAETERRNWLRLHAPDRDDDNRPSYDTQPLADDPWRPGKYELHYRPDTPYGRKYPTFVLGTYPNRATAVGAQRACPNADAIEVVEVEE